VLKFRKATLKDIPKMQKIIQQRDKETGIILQRSDDEVATNIRKLYSLVVLVMNWTRVTAVLLHLFHSFQLLPES